jgi:hypothetical protein
MNFIVKNRTDLKQMKANLGNLFDECNLINILYDFYYDTITSIHRPDVLLGRDMYTLLDVISSVLREPPTIIYEISSYA